VNSAEVEVEFCWGWKWYSAGVELVVCWRGIVFRLGWNSYAAGVEVVFCHGGSGIILGVGVIFC